MGGTADRRSGIVDTIRELDAAGIDYERKGDPPPEPASPFLAITDPRTGNEASSLKPPVSRYAHKSAKHTATVDQELSKPETKRNEAPRGLRTRPQPAERRSDPPTSAKAEPVTQQRSGTGKRTASKELEIAKNESPSKTLVAREKQSKPEMQSNKASGARKPEPLKKTPSARPPAVSSAKPAAQTPNSAKPSPAISAPTGRLDAPTYPPRSKWKFLNFFRTPGPGPVDKAPGLELLAPLTASPKAQPAPKTPISASPESSRKPLVAKTSLAAKSTNAKAKPIEAKAPVAAQAADLSPKARASKPPMSDKLASSDAKPPAQQTSALARPHHTEGKAHAPAVTKHKRVPSRSLDPTPPESIQVEPSLHGSESIKASSIPEQGARDEFYSANLSPKDKLEGIPAVEEAFATRGLLSVEIPDANLDRYSVMFGKVLKQRNSSLLLRRKGQLEELKVPDVPKV